MQRYSVIGRRLPVHNAEQKAMGTARYGEDIVLPNMLVGKLLGSPHAHAKILNIDTSKAARLPGVKAVITHKDSAGKKKIMLPVQEHFLKEIADEYPLAKDRVRHVGDTVAAVAAIDEDIAQEAVDLIEVDYEVLPHVMDAIEAMRPGAPQLHDERPGNIGGKLEFQYGDVEKGFNESDHVREDRFILQNVNWATLERNGCVASYDAIEDKMTIWGSMQFIYWIRGALAYLLDMPWQKVRVVHENVGGGFGQKGEAFNCHFCAALLAKKTGRPVKIYNTREEDFYNRLAKTAMIIDIKTGIKRDGTLIARDAKVICDMGAYIAVGFFGILSGIELCAPYRLPNLKFEGISVYTNKPGAGAFRGAGNHQMYYASETQLDAICRDLGIDPLEMRLKNSLTQGEETPLQWKIPSCALKECLERSRDELRWKDRRGKLPKYQGLGCGAHLVFAGPVFSDKALRSSVRLNGDGTVTVIGVGNDSGSGQYGAICQVVAEEMGIAYEDVKRLTGDTDVNLFDIGDHTGNHLQALGYAARIAAEKVKKEIFEVVARELEANPEDLEARDRRIYVKGTPSKGMTFMEAAVRTLDEKGVVEHEGEYYCYAGKNFVQVLRTGFGAWSDTWSFGAATAEIEIDPETGLLKLNHVVSAYDLGTCINPMGAETQIFGGASCGIGNMISEEIVWEKDGHIMNANLHDYRVLRATEMPQIKPILIETYDPYGPFGAKELGMGCMMSPPNAVANAIQDATGVLIKDFPITAEKILEAVEGGK